jgi:hypothetical protein
LRKIFGLIALCLAATAAASYLICTFLTDGNPWLKNLWRLSASAGLIAYVFELLCRRFDAAETKQIRQELDGAKSLAGEANARAEKERLARLDIEAKLAPRSLTKQQFESLKSELARLGKHEFDIWIYGESKEIMDLSVQIGTIFWQAGWDPTLRRPLGAFRTGISICKHSASVQQTHESLEKIVVALNSVGLSAEIGNDFSDIDSAPASILYKTASKRNTNATMRMLLGAKP